jgi:hypothetical protein
MNSILENLKRMEDAMCPYLEESKRHRKQCEELLWEDYPFGIIRTMGNCIKEDHIECIKYKEIQKRGLNK